MQHPYLIERGRPHAEAIAMLQALRPRAIRHPAQAARLEQFGR